MRPYLNTLRYESMSKIEKHEFENKHYPIYDLIEEYLEKEFNWWKWSCIEFSIDDSLYYVYDYDDNIKYKFCFSDSKLTLL